MEGLIFGILRYLKFTGLRDRITCNVNGRTASIVPSDLPLIIN